MFIADGNVQNHGQCYDVMRDQLEMKRWLWHQQSDIDMERKEEKRFSSSFFFSAAAWPRLMQFKISMA